LVHTCEVKMIKKPHSIDVHVGQKLRERRILLGISQEKLGKTLDLSFQQIQKYERGTNRISSSRLFLLADVLEVSISYFFDELKGESKSHKEEREPFRKRETLELCRHYYALPEDVRKSLFTLAKRTANHFR